MHWYMLLLLIWNCFQIGSRFEKIHRFFGTQRCRLLSKGWTKLKTFYLVHSGMDSAFQWWMDREDWCDLLAKMCGTPDFAVYILLNRLVENTRKFRESAPNQILIFGKPPPRVGVSENVWFFKFKCEDRAIMRYI